MQNFMEIGPVVFAGEYLGMKIGCSSYNTSKPVLFLSQTADIESPPATVVTCLASEGRPDSVSLITLMWRSVRSIMNDSFPSDWLCKSMCLSVCSLVYKNDLSYSQMVARSVSPMVVAAASTVDLISRVSPTSIPLVSH